jgi:hypothetical protein
MQKYQLLGKHREIIAQDQNVEHEKMVQKVCLKRNR